MLLLLVLLLLLIPIAGCGASLRKAAAEAPHAAAPAVVEETLKAGEDARTRQRVALILETPEMQQAIAAVAKAAVGAALEEASSDASEERISELTRSVSRAVAETIATDIVPAVVSGTRESLRQSVSAKDIKALEVALTSLAAASTRAAMQSAAKEIPTTVGPAVRESLARELTAPDLHDALTGLVGDATRQAVASSREAITSAQQAKAAEGGPTLLERARHLLTVSWVLVFVFAMLLATLIAWTLRMRRRAKRYRGALLELITQAEERAHEEGGEPTRAQRRFIELLQ